MKVTAFGDIHGNREWIYKFSHLSDPDKIVFLGDYFDSHENKEPSTQLEVFEEIVEQARKDPRVILLIGNHDLHYIIDEQYSGYQPGYAKVFKKALHKNRDILQACVILDGVLYSHAGITNTWMKDNNIDPNGDLEQQVNSLFKVRPSAFGVQYKDRSTSPYGEDINQGPMWVRPKSLISDKMDMWMVVGHTRQSTGITIDTTEQLALIDYMPHEFLDVIDGIDFKRRT